MKTLKFVFLAILIAFSATLSAQDYAFKVLAHKGNNEIKSAGAWQPLKTGATLQAGDEVKLGDNSYIGLVHSSGKPVELKQAGVHSVSELVSKVPAGSSVLNKYTDFILSSNDEGGNRMAATGSVTRKIPAAPGTIKVLLPENTKIFNKTVVVNWAAQVSDGPYVVKVMNLFEDVLHQVETNEKSYTVDLSDSKLASENAFLIEVSSKKAGHVTSARHMVQRMSKAEYDSIAGIVSGFSSELQQESAMSQVLLATFFEEKKLIADAIVAYEKASKLAPQAYDETYSDFMVRNNLK